MISRNIRIALAVAVLALAGVAVIDSANASPSAVEYALILALIP